MGMLIAAAVLPRKIYTPGVLPPSEPPTLTEGLIYTSYNTAKGYNAFGYPFLTSDGVPNEAFKQSPTHAGEGDFVIIRNLDGGGVGSTTRHYINDGTGNVQTSQGSFYRDPIGGYLICLNIAAATNPTGFLKVETYRILETTFIANPNAVWTKMPTVDFTGYGANIVIGDLWGDPIQLPSGKIKFPIHLRATVGTRHVATTIDTDDGGATFSIGPVILNKTTTGSFPNGTFSEIGMGITEVGASDANTKIIALLRNEDYGYWTHVRSSDGGVTWTENTSDAFGYEFDSAVTPLGSPSRIPITIRLYNGLVWFCIGYRWLSGGNAMKIISMSLSPSEAFNNPNPKSSEVVTIVREGTELYTNVMNSDEQHFGYPMFLETEDQGLWIHYYDPHDPMAAWFDGNEKCDLWQIKITD